MGKGSHRRPEDRRRFEDGYEGVHWPSQDEGEDWERDEEITHIQEETECPE